ncbi:hypothetical protein IAT38_006897 [Cryptococcus sp. DSM 104549]
MSDASSNGSIPPHQWVPSADGTTLHHFSYNSQTRQYVASGHTAPNPNYAPAPTQRSATWPQTQPQAGSSQWSGRNPARAGAATVQGTAGSMGPPAAPTSLFPDSGGFGGTSGVFTVANPEQALRYVQQATEYNDELVEELAENPECNDLGSAMLQYFNNRAKRTVAFIPNSLAGGPEAIAAWSNSSARTSERTIRDPPKEVAESVGMLFTAMDKNGEMVERLMKLEQGHGGAPVRGQELRAVNVANQSVNNARLGWPENVDPLVSRWAESTKALSEIQGRLRDVSRR